MKKADAILTADIEIRKDAPICRTDDYFATFERKIKWLKRLQEKHECPILDAGDLFDKKYKVNPSHELLNWAIENLPTPFYTIPGNHDLPGKSIENYNNSAMAVLERAGVIKVPIEEFEILKEKIYSIDKSAFKINQIAYIYGFPWGAEISHPSLFHDMNIALVHAMVYKNNPPFPGCEGYTTRQIMKLLHDFDLIVTGHNHQTFTDRVGNQILVNPGSLLRNDADQIDHKPCVFLWYADENEIEQVFVPIRQGVISREHIDQVKERENRLDAFTKKLGEQVIEGINFEKNLEQAVAVTSKPVRDKIWQYYEGRK